MNSSTQTVDHPLSPKGRFGRLSYAAWTFLSSIIFFIIFFALALSSGLFTAGSPQEPNFPIFLILVVAIVYIGFIYLSFIFTIRRLHDRNQSGWLSLLMIVPLANLFLMIYLFCAKGTEGENNFGLARITSDWEKVLGWIYIIIIPLAFIFGILAAISIPAYQDYVQRSQHIQMEQQN
ncbi:DUF805 domain-containing protein [Acinetobacter gyllenbergii]|uniref:DUF805 domain-containing protein n=1 Tax=Acinetobacter gyllenbergii TaxID=134534 RepID=UPI0021CF7925|nr:DUF805 domain-containing protein [Acinetobacter gyllenbergii]MCU4579615.1 DUF805 domain-containing protein [Acinetobacter gyllenbergii]